MVQKRHRLGVNEVLIALGPSMEKNLTGIMESAKNDGDAEAAYKAGIALRHMLLGRLYAEKFINTNDKTHEDGCTRNLLTLPRRPRGSNVPCSTRNGRL